METNQNIHKYVFVIMIALGIWVGVQQYQISRLAAREGSGATVQAPDMPVPDYVLAFDQYDLFGIVVAKADGSFAIESEIVDTSKFDVSKPPLGDLPKRKKVFTVNINSNTVFPHEKFDKLKIGDPVQVSTLESAQRSDTLTGLDVAFGAGPLQALPPVTTQ